MKTSLSLWLILLVVTAAAFAGSSYGGKKGGHGVPDSEVPEPQTYLLVGSVLAGAAGRQAWKKFRR